MSSVPKNLKFTTTHEWVSLVEDEATIGITDHAQELLGDLVFVELPEVGNKVCSGDSIGVVESVKAASDFYTPLSGVVVAINQKVCENPALVNTDPYGAGWLIKLKPDAITELNDLLDFEAYTKETEESQ